MAALDGHSHSGHVRDRSHGDEIETDGWESGEVSDFSTGMSQANVRVGCCEEVKIETWGSRV